MSVNHICPSCDEIITSSFYSVGDVPVHSCVLMKNLNEALKFPVGEIVLGFCENCGFISNLVFEPSLVDYSNMYEDQQCFSSTFNSFAKELVNRLVEKYDLYNKDILEIGCGKGDLLKIICELGNNRGVGIDPAYESGRLQGEVVNRLTFIKDYYSERYANYHGDFVLCRHTLEHVSNTAEFVSSVRRSIGDRLDTIVFFEVPDVTRILRELAFWDIYYEHCSYFSPGSIARLFRHCGFQIIDLSRGFNDQYLFLEARPVRQSSCKLDESEEVVDELAKDVTYFSTHCQEKVSQWKDRLNQITADGKSAIIWGSGSKCVSFLTTLEVKNQITYVIDINPYRHGKFFPRIGRNIMPPEFLIDYKPDITFVMNPMYFDEIQKMIVDMGVSTELISIV